MRSPLERSLSALSLAAEPMLTCLSEDAKVEGVLLADIGHGPAHQRCAADPCRIVIGTPPIGDYSREVWRLPDTPVTSGWADGIGYAQGGDFLFAHMLIPESGDTELAQLTRDAYSRLLAFIRSSPCPELLRMWNYLPGINDHECGMERYQAFCKGRSLAFSDANIPPRKFPAATAIGCPADGLSVHLLATRTPGRPIGNPRQVEAYEYPPLYGPRPPAFARAMCYSGPRGSDELSVSGTSSIVGHQTMHPKDPGRQLRETLRNLDILVDRARFPLQLLKVYLRDPQRMAEIAPPLRQWAGPQARIMYLQGAICRHTLDIEIEAHCSMPGTRPRIPPHHRVG